MKYSASFVLMAMMSLTGQYTWAASDLTIRIDNTDALRPALSFAPVQQSVRGKITDGDSGEPLPGVNVLVKGTTSGTTSDINGEYTLAVDNTAATLVYSFIGYQTQEVAIGNRSVVDVSLSHDMTALEEVVVIGYGTVEKRDITGSVASVSAAEIAQVPVIGLDQALQGRAPGVFVTNSNANPGGEVNIRIRGTNSIQGNNEPLYVIDGFIGGNINTVNPTDIESIEVLKDASATSIYGSRGANGVVLVTTKRGKKGQTSFNFDAFQGFQQRSNTIDMMGAKDYARFVNALDTDRSVALTFPDIDNLQYDTDWQDMIFRTALWQQYSLSASGGTDNVNYYISGGYVDQEGIMAATDYNRLNVRANVDVKASKGVSIGARLGFSRINRTIQQGEEIRNVDSDVGPMVGRSLSLQPTEPAYDADGKLLPTITDFSDLLRPIPLFELENVHARSLANSINGNLYAEFQILKGLKFRSTYGFDIMDNKRNRYTPTTVFHNNFGNRGNANISIANDIGWLNENYLSFDKEFGSHSLQVLGGMTVQGFDRESLSVSGSDFSVDDFLYHNIGSAGTTGAPQSDMSAWRQVSFFGRVQYNIAHKYLLTFNGRYDGNSKFGRDHKWGLFPSGAVAWRLSEEDFIKQTNLFTDLKLRASYGISGSEALGPYQSLAAFDNENPGVIYGFANQVGFAPTRLENRGLKWETTEQLDVGVDFSVLGGRLSFVLDYFKKTTNDLFLNKPVPSTTGQPTMQANIGSLRNSGFEFGLDAVAAHGGDFTWNVGVNGTFQNSEILNLGDVDQIIFNLGTAHSMSVMRVGERLGTFFGYNTNGLWNTDDPDLGSYTQFGTAVKPGDVKMIDRNGDGDVNADDREIIGYSQPKFFGGLNNRLSYKNFDLSVFLQYVSGNRIFNRTAATGYYNPQTYGNHHVDFNNAWTPDNQDTNIPRVGAYLPTDMYDIYLEDGAFVRLREVTLGYNLPSSVLEKFGVSRLRLYASGTNLLTFTKYSGYDPEVNYVAGSVTVLNMDSGSYPRARTFILGLNLSF